MSGQTRIVLGGVALVAMIAGFWFVLLAPKRTEIGTAKAQIAQAEARRAAAQTSATQAERDRAGYVRDYETVARLGKAVPADDDIASLVYQLETIARANDIDFRTVKLTASAASTPATTPSSTAAAGTEDKKPAGDESSTATATVAPPVVAQPPPGTVVGEAGLVTVPFTLSFDGDYMKLQRLLKAINGLAKNAKSGIKVQGRLLTVDGFSLAAGPDGFPQLKATVSATAYLAPAADDVAAAATPQGPAGAATGTSTTTAIVTPNAQGAGR